MTYDGDPAAALRAQLKARRRRLGLTQQQVGQRLGRSSYNTTHQWEAGVNDPKLSNFLQWVHCLGLRVVLVEEDHPAEEAARGLEPPSATRFAGGPLHPEQHTATDPQPWVFGYHPHPGVA